MKALSTKFCNDREFRNCPRNSPLNFPISPHRYRAVLHYLAFSIFFISFLAQKNFVVAAADSKVAITQTEFDNPPKKYFYFPKSQKLLLLESKTHKLWRSEDEGKSWTGAKLPSNTELSNIILHPYDSSKAVAFTNGLKHYTTKDQGETWVEFTTELPPSNTPPVFVFHSQRPGYVIFHGMQCPKRQSDCQIDSYHTEDFFASSPKILQKAVSSCTWAQANKALTGVAPKTVFCIKTNGVNPTPKERITKSQLLRSNDLFEKSESVDFDFDGRPDGGVIGFSITQGFLVAAVRRDVDSEELTLFVSQDGKTWAEAHVPTHDSLSRNGYTILDSLPHSIAVGVMLSSSDSLSTLYFSNSNGTYFSESLNYVNRELEGIIDFDRVSGMEHMLFANTVTNSKDFTSGGSSSAEKEVRTMITYNSGGDWSFLSPPSRDCANKEYACASNKDKIKKGECSLHLSSISSPHNAAGSLLTRAAAPGFIIGVGNVGSKLKPYDDRDTFYSTDGGISWTCAQPKPHKYTLGDMGSLLVLVPDKDSAKKVAYSYDQGVHWNAVDLPIDIKPTFLVTEKASTSQSAILFGQKVNGVKYALLHMDFSKFHSRKCEFDSSNPGHSKDIELWKPKLPSGTDQNTCIMGKKISYYRRKPQSECYMGEEFKTEVPSEAETCPCSAADYECDYNFARSLTDPTKCVSQGPPIQPKGVCNSSKDSTYMGSSGFRKIPGNVCSQSMAGAIILDEPVKTKCSTASLGNKANLHYYRKALEDVISGHYAFGESEAILVWTMKGTLWSSLNWGASWDQPSKLSGSISRIIGHEFDKEWAYGLLTSGDLIVTSDQGKSFKKMKCPIKIDPNKSLGALEFHPEKPEYLIVMGKVTPDSAKAVAYLTLDGGENWVQLVKDKEDVTCQFSANEEFSMKNRSILCLIKGAGELIGLDNKGSNPSTILKEVQQFDIISKYLVVLAKVKDKLEIQLTQDGNEFSRAVFPPDIPLMPAGFVVHESASKQGDGLFLTLNDLRLQNGTSPSFSNTNSPYGLFFVSNSNGTYYSLSLPDVYVIKAGGQVALSPVEGVRGIAIGNQLLSVGDNGAAISKSKITFDNGGSWADINTPPHTTDNDPKCKDGGCSLHLHTLPDRDRVWNGLGHLQAGGRIIGVGNVGKYLLPYDEGRTYFSSDAGLSWSEIKSSEALYAIGDSGHLLVLVDDEAPTKSIQYSTDEGKNWAEYQFADNSIRATRLLAPEGGTSQRFLVMGLRASSQGLISEMYQIDLSGLYDHQCTKDEVSKWTLTRPDDDSCILGQRVSFNRRKPGSACYIGEDSSVLSIGLETCKCSKLDYECEVGYWRSDFGHGDCVLHGMDPYQPKTCQPGTTYTGNSGYRRISASVCKDGLDMSKPIKRTCPMAQGITMSQTIFEHDLDQYFYFRESTNLMVRLNNDSVYISQNEGLSFSLFPSSDSEPIMAMFHHPFIDNTAVFLGKNKVHYLTHSEGRTHTQFSTPTKVNSLQISGFEFHPNKDGWLIFMGEEDCDQAYSSHCRSTSFLSKDNGETWKRLISYVKRCSFAKTDHFLSPPDGRILCEVYDRQTGSQRGFRSEKIHLIYSDDEFNSKTELLPDIIGASTFYEFMVVATPKDNSLNLMVSMDGVEFSPVQYPPNVQVAKDSFTVAESDTHALFLHVTSTSSKNRAMGPLLISNANGTAFILSLPDVNRDDNGFVDFEKMAGVEGVLLANKVTNSLQVSQGAAKKVASLISFDNGSGWDPLALKDSELCKKHNSGSDFDCRLNLHSFTERSDPENIFSSPAAVGMMIGVGNIGPTLSSYSSGSTFFTKDAGKSWVEIQSTPHRHEFGDSGAIILLAEDQQRPVNQVRYSTDMGNSFKTLKFNDHIQPIRVKETAVEPQSTSQKLLVLGHTKTGNKFAIVHLDFSGLYSRACNSDGDNGDFESWNPASIRELENNNQCFFGHEVTYWRRKPDVQCRVDRKYLDPVTHKKNCTCTRQDFECDFNFFRNKKGDCELIDGLQPVETSCSNGESAFFRSTGYRKLPISTCEGGADLSKSKQIWCPGHGLSGWAIFFIVILPLSGLGVLLYSLIIRKRPYVLSRHLPSWSRVQQNILPYLCFIPATLVRFTGGSPSFFSSSSYNSSSRQPGLWTRLRNRFSSTRQAGYAPVAQYDYDLDEDYIDGPVEVQLEDYDLEDGPEILNLDDDDEFSDDDQHRFGK